MTLYVGDAASEVFSTGVAGETFTRTASYINGASTVWNPTFSDLGGGFYRYTYTTAAVGFHEWVGNGSATGPLAINFDVDSPASAILINSPSVASAPGALSFGQGGGPRPARVDLEIVQGENWSLPMRLLAGGVLIDTTTYTGAAMQVRATP